MSARFPRAVRLRVRREFTAVQDRGRRVSTKYMTVLGQPNGGAHDRLGIIASRRLGGAVVRNRAKRVLRDVFRRYLAATGAPKALDLVVIPKTDLLRAPVQTIDADFAAAVRRLRPAR